MAAFFCLHTRIKKYFLNNYIENYSYGKATTFWLEISIYKG